MARRGERWELLKPWFDHRLWDRVNAKANGVVTTHAWNLVRCDRRWARTVWEKTGKTEWTLEEARAFLRSRMGWASPVIMRSIFEAYEGGRCVHDCRHCNGAPFREQGLERMSLDIINPRSSLPLWDHATAWRCKNYNTGKGGRCLDEFVDDLLLDSIPDSIPESSPDPWCPTNLRATAADQRLW